MKAQALNRRPRQGRRGGYAPSAAAATRSGRTRTPTASTSPSSPSTPRAWSCCCSTRHDAAEPFQTITLDPEHNRSFAIWHVYVRGLRAPVFYALRVFGPKGDEARGLGHRFDHREGAHRPVRPRPGPYAVGARLGVRARRQPGDLAALGGHRPGRLRLGGRPAAEPADGGPRHLRAARRRFHPLAERAGAAAGDVRRRGREDPVPEERSGSRPSSCCRCSTSTTARSATSTGAG